MIHNIQYAIMDIGDFASERYLNTLESICYTDPRYI